MASFVLTDTEVFAGALDATCFTNTVSLESNRDVVDATTMCSGGWRTSVAGLLTWTATVGGPQNLTASSATTTYTPDEYYDLTVGTRYPLAFVPQGAAVGSIAYFSEGMLSRYSPVGGAVGDLAVQTTDWTIGTTYPLVRGTMVHHATLSASGGSSVVNLGAVSASQRLYCSVHVLQRTGTATLTSTLYSDDNAGLSSATTQVALSVVSARGATIASVAGPITDTYYAFGFAVGGSGTVDVRAFIGIQ